MKARMAWKKRLARAGLVLLGLFVVTALAALISGWRAFGQRADGARRERIERSPQWQDGRFENPQPLANDGVRMLTGMFAASPHTSPDDALPVEKIDPRRFRTPPASGLRVTWLGHASALIEIEVVSTPARHASGRRPFSCRNPGKAWNPPRHPPRRAGGRPCRGRRATTIRLFRRRLIKY